MQSVYILGAVGLGLLVPRLSVGATMEGRRVTQMLFAVGAAFVPFIGIIYSLPFLVVQFGTTTFTPRLNLFRDSPIVWHGFSFFTGVIVFAFTAALAIGKAERTTLLVPVSVIVAVLSRSPYSAVFRPAPSARSSSPRRWRRSLDAAARWSTACTPTRLPPRRRRTAGRHPVSARGAAAMFCGRVAQRRFKRSTSRAGPRRGTNGRGDGGLRESRRRDPERSRVAVIHGGDELAERELIRALRVGVEQSSTRTRPSHCACSPTSRYGPLSPAISDPATAVQALDQVDGLLRLMVSRERAVGTVKTPDGQARVLLRPPTWEDYVGVALDETIANPGLVGAGPPAR